MTVSLASIRAVVLDVEGTTTPIGFVHDVLFPYARARVGASMSAAIVADLADQHAADRANALAPPPLDDGVAYVLWLIDHDRKVTALKALQGRIWEAGYRTGELVSEVFADVRPALERWAAHGIAAGIFSSGSVLAQQLLFAHSIAGDLRPLVGAYFDTTTGAKADPESYRVIAAAMQEVPRALLFVSDVTAELAAAAHAGWHTALSIRPGNPAQPYAANFRAISSFDELV